MLQYTMTKVETYIQYIKDNITTGSFYLTRCNYEELEYLVMEPYIHDIPLFRECYSNMRPLSTEAEKELRDYLVQRFSRLAEVLK